MPFSFPISLPKRKNVEVGPILDSAEPTRELSLEREAILQEEVARLRSELSREASRRSEYRSRLQHCDEAICKVATELATEKSLLEQADKAFSNGVIESVTSNLDLDALSIECGVLEIHKSNLESQMTSEKVLRALDLPVQRWVLISATMLLKDDVNGALKDELDLLEVARSGRDEDLESLLREIEILEVTNTQLRSFAPAAEQQAAESQEPLTPRGKRHRLHRFGRWLIGKDSAQASLHTTNLAAASQDELLVDDIIACSWECQSWQPGTYVKYPERTLRCLLSVVRDIFMSECSLLDIETPINVCGDIHGQYHDLLRLFDAGGTPPSSNYLFLGDYVDRGRQSIETATLLFTYKVKYRENMFLLRGNHECASITRMYGFYDECKRRYSIGLWKEFCSVFNCMPVCSLIDDKIMCMHGGLSPQLEDFDEVRTLRRPVDVPNRGIMCDLLWADPDRYGDGWQPSDRGVSYVFGANVVHEFVAKHELDLICRAHQVVEDGYEFFAQRKLVTVFSAPNYCGEFDNCGAFMVVNKELLCRFEVLQPRAGVWNSTADLYKKSS